MIRIFLLLLTFSFVWIEAKAEDSIQHFLSFNGNLYLPRKSDKGMFPILWYDKKADPKILIGGYGIGYALVKHLPRYTIKGEVNLSRLAYWETPVGLSASTGQPLGDFQTSSRDYNLRLMGLAHYRLGKKLSAGTGFGAQFLILSLSRFPDERYGFDEGRRKTVVNKFYRPVIPIIPFELSWSTRRSMVNVRYEHALADHHKKALAKYEKDRFGLIVFEYGIRLK